MYKLPMFGLRDPDQVLREINDCRAQFPTAYIRLVAFDDLRQVQITSEWGAVAAGTRSGRCP